MKVLVVGSEGFIGSHIVARFLQKGCKVVGCDLLNIKPTYDYFQISRFTPDYESIFSSNEFDVCINAAGNGSVPVSIEKPLLDFEANVYDNFRLLEQIRLHQPNCKFVYFSSAAVYGNPLLPINEESKIQPLSPYGWHKLQGEYVCKEYNQLYGIPTFILRVFSVFGPKLKKQIIWDLYHKFKIHKKVEVFGTGEESRDFIYIDDLVQALDLILKKGGSSYGLFNIATGKEIFISHVVELLSRKLGLSNHDYFFNGKVRIGDPQNWQADISKLQSLGFIPSFDFEVGLNETLTWLKANDET